MAIASFGNALTTKMLQPGGVYNTDSYGLLTGKVTYLCDKTVGGTAVKNGDVHPNYTDMFVHKFTLTKGSLDLDTIEAEYVGVATAIGTTTLPNVTASLGLTSEHITTHPNFFGPTAPYVTAIAGNGTTFVASPLGADYKVGGDLGATFKGTTTNAGGFVGFLDSTTAIRQSFYGKNQYLAPTTAFSGSIYTTNVTNVTTIKNALGKTSGTNSFAGIKLLPDHLGTSWTVTNKGGTLHTILLSQVSFEDYCVPTSGTPKIFKINYEIRFNRDGYPAQVYLPATA